MPTKDGKPTRKEKSAENKRAYKTARTQVGKNYRTRAAREYVPPPAKRLPREMVDQRVLMRARGDRTDESCVDEILDRMSRGDTLTDALSFVGVSTKQWRHWLKHKLHGLDKEVKDITLEMQADAWADDIIKEVYDATVDDWQLVRMRAEFKKWLMGRNNIKYSDKHTLVMEGGEKPIRQITSDMTAQEAAQAWNDIVKRENNA